jgi:hypothetical protein
VPPLYCLYLTSRELDFLKFLAQPDGTYPKKNGQVTLKNNALFYYTSPLNETVESLIDRGYIRKLKCYCGPLKVEDTDAVGIKLTEAGKLVVGLINSEQSKP